MKVGIAIVHYGDDQLLENCTASLKKGGVVARDIRVHNCNKDNIGFSNGNNVLIKNLLAENDVMFGGYDWIWLLNNDTTVDTETIKSIHQVLPELPPNVGVVGFKILSMENPDLIHHAGTLQAIPSGVHKSGSVKLRQFTKRTCEKWVTFASVLIRRDVFLEVGLLDGRMINYCSDSDFCYRARYAGWMVIYEPSFIVKHKIGQSANPSSEQRKVLIHDSFIFQNKWINGKLFHDLDHELV